MGQTLEPVRVLTSREIAVELNIETFRSLEGRELVVLAVVVVLVAVFLGLCLKQSPINSLINILDREWPKVLFLR